MTTDIKTLSDIVEKHVKMKKHSKVEENSHITRQEFIEQLKSLKSNIIKTPSTR